MNIRLQLMALALAITGAGQIPTPLTAQVNIEALRRQDPTSGFSGTVGVDFAIRTGNVDLVELALNGRLDHAAGAARTFVVGNGDLGLLGGKKFTNAGLLHARHSRAVTSRLVPEVFGQIDYSESRRLDFRGLAGGGLRIGLLPAGTVLLWVATGYMFEHERLDLPASAAHPRRTSVHRSSSYVSLRAIPDPRLTLVSTSYLQPQIDELADVRILHNLRLGVGLTTATSFVVSFDLRYDSRPPDGIAELDTTLRTGVTVTF